MESGKSIIIMKKIYFLLAFCALLIGCNVNEPINIDRDIFSASMESFGNDTRTSLTAGLDVAWSEGDQLTVFRGNHLGDKYQILCQYAGKPYGDFELVEENSTGDNFSSGTELPANVAIYPYSENLTIAKNVEGDNYSYTISGVEFPAQQNYVKNSFAEESFIMAAVTESLSDHKLKFKNVGGAIKLQLKGTGTIKAISIKGNNNENLAGTANVTMSATTTPTFEFSSSTKEVTLDCGANGVELNSAEIVNFIISLPVVNFTKGFRVTITDINGKIEELSTSNPNMIQRSSVLKMPEKTVAFEVQTPEEPTVPQMYYGYIPLDIIERYDIAGDDSKGAYSDVTEECISDCIELGYIVEMDAQILGTIPMATPEHSLSFFALPSSSGLEARSSVVGAGGKFSQTNPILASNGEQKITIRGKSYDCYGEYEIYAWSNGVYYIDKPKYPQMFYGYIPSEVMSKHGLTSSSSYDQISEECIKECLDKGMIIRKDVEIMDKTSFREYPSNSLLFVAVSENSIFSATKCTGVENNELFDGLTSANGDYAISLYEKKYLLYGEYSSTSHDGDNQVYFKVGYRSVNEGELPMYYGYIPYMPDDPNDPADYSEVTGDYILKCVNEYKTITKVVATTMERTSFGVVPKYSMLLIAVPSDSGLVVTKDNGLGGKVPFGLDPGTNGDFEIDIEGKLYKLYGEYQNYSIANNKYFYIDQTEKPKPMYYGYIPTQLIIDHGLNKTDNWYENVTEECILEAVNLGKITKVGQATTMDKTSFGIVPEDTMLLIAVPSDNGLIVTKDDARGNKIQFTVEPLSNGDYTTEIDGISYTLYGEYQNSDIANNKHFYIDKK